MSGNSQRPYAPNLGESVLDLCLLVYTEEELGALSETQFSDLVLIVADALKQPPYKLSKKELQEIKQLIKSVNG